MVGILEAEVLERYPRISLYNSPYPAHDQGRAIDLYPATNTAPSPIAGEVLDTLTTRAPSKPYAVEHDHLILVDTGEFIARVLHVEPGVEVGQEVAVGDPLGEMVRSGYFAPWVGNHIHLEFRNPDANPYRASGSVRLEIEAEVEPVSWDGTGIVVEVGETYVALDRPEHPAPGERFAAIASESDAMALDGGLPHYDGGGVLVNDDGAANVVSLLETRIGTVAGRDVAWDDLTVIANGEEITGLSLFAGREELGAKLVHPGHGWEEGEEIEVAIRSGNE